MKENDFSFHRITNLTAGDQLLQHAADYMTYLQSRKDSSSMAKTVLTDEKAVCFEADTNCTSRWPETCHQEVKRVCISMGYCNSIHLSRWLKGSTHGDSQSNYKQVTYKIK